MINFRGKRYRFSFLSFISNALVLALLPTLIVSFFIPKLVSKYNLNLQETHFRGKDKKLIFFEDLDGDGKKEEIELINYRNRFASCLFLRNQTTIIQQLNLYGKLPNQENVNVPIYSDINKDGVKEVFIFTQKEDSLFLNAVDYKTFKVILYGRFIAKIGDGSGKMDFVLRPIINHDYNHDKIDEIYFILNACYALFPRKIMAYDFVHDSLISTINTGSQHFVTPIKDKKNNLLLISTTKATDNCPANFPYLYPDTCAWLFGFNDHLKLIFKPIPFGAIASSINGPFLSGDEYHYYLLNHSRDNTNQVFSIDLEGKIIKEKRMPDFSQQEKMTSIVINRKRHYILNTNTNNIFDVWEYDPDKVEFVKNEFTKNLPTSPLVAIKMGSGKDGFITMDSKSNLAYLFLDHLKQKVSFNKPLYIKHYNLYFQSKKIGNQYKIVVTDRDYLYTYLLSHNYLYPFRYIVFFFVYLFFFGFILLVEYLYKRRVRKMEELHKEINKLQLQLANSQLDPHFMYNALNTVSAMILKGERFDAYDLLNSFSNLMRIAMLFSNKNRWSLAEELKFTQDYLVLMKARFPLRFEYKIEIPNEIQTENAFVPRLLIQNFVENAVKHAWTNIDYTGQLDILVIKTESILKITITDNGIGRKKAIQNSEQSSNKSGNGIRLNGKQVEVYNKLYHTNINFQITDVKENGVGKGTQISIIIPLG